VRYVGVLTEMRRPGCHHLPASGIPDPHTKALDGRLAPLEYATKHPCVGIVGVKKLEEVLAQALTDDRIDELLLAIGEAIVYDANGLRNPDMPTLPLSGHAHEMMRRSVRAWVQEVVVQPVVAAGAASGIKR
jgi:hypothetical protein